jgi:HSP20 family protein
MMSLMESKKKAEPVAGGAVSPADDTPSFLGRLRGEFDRLFARFAREWPPLSEGAAWPWGLEVREEEAAFVVRAEAPGFEATDFDVQLRGNRLVMRAARKTETEKAEDGKRREVTRRECYESVMLPPEIAADKITAEYHNGVLTVKLPKTAEAKGKPIPVKAT